MRKSGDLSRQALLEASCRLFAERGMTVVKLSEIAREAGVDACMVNYHFGGKEGLIDAVVDVALGRWKQVDLRKYYEENGPLLETREGQKVFVTGMVDCVFQKLCGGEDDPSRCLLLQLLQHPSEMRTRIVEEHLRPLYQLFEEIYQRITGVDDAESAFCWFLLFVSPAYVHTACPGLLELLHPRGRVGSPFERRLQFVATQVLLNGMGLGD